MQSKAILKTLCTEAKQSHFASVCVNTYWVPLCTKLLEGSDVNVCCVVGFPLGAMSTKAKAFETKQARADGAQEIDMVINVGELKAGHDQAVLEDIQAVVEAAQGACVKVILENCLLTKEEIIRACQLCVQAKADFVKTSTGFFDIGRHGRRRTFDERKRAGALQSESCRRYSKCTGYGGNDRSRRRSYWNKCRAKIDEINKRSRRWFAFFC